MKDLGIEIGRDRFQKVLYRNGLRLNKLPKAPQTTDSSHSLGVFPNRVKGMELTAPNQAWASDITYIKVEDGFMLWKFRFKMILIIDLVFDLVLL